MPFQENRENELIMSQKIFIQKDVLVNETYSRLIAQYFHSEIGHVNFKDSKSAADYINLWTYGRTQQKIRSFIRPGSLMFKYDKLKLYFS